MPIRQPISVAPPRPELELRRFHHTRVLDRLLEKLAGVGVGQDAHSPDPTMALADAVAAMCDVLSFYQERLVNEGYIGSARQPRSVFELARMIGYRPAPGLAATAHLFYTVDKSMVDGVHIPAGSRVGAIPKPDALPPVFETTDDLLARPELNALKVIAEYPIDLEKLIPPSGQSEAEEKTLPLDCGDATLVPGNLLRVANGSTDIYLTLTSARVDRPNGRTIAEVVFRSRSPARQDAATGQDVADIAGAAEPDDDRTVDAFRRRTQLFGSGAPELPVDPRKPIKGKSAWREVDNDDPPEPDTLDLEGHFPTLLPGSRICIGLTSTNAGEPLRIFTVKSSHLIVRSGYGITGNATRLVLGEPWRTLSKRDGFAQTVRDVEVFHDAVTCRLLQRTAPSLREHYLANGWLTVRGPAEALGVGRKLIIEGAAPVGQHLPADWAPQVLTIAKTCSPAGAVSKLADVQFSVVEDLANDYDPVSVVLRGNVVAASHGDSYEQVLGGGDASRTNQRFLLARSPLTHLMPVQVSPNESPQIQVSVAGENWTAIDSLVLAPANGPNFAVDIDQGGAVSVLFGDGRNGARLPTGPENVSVRYRVGLGTAGNLPRGQLKMPLDHPFGIQEVAGLEPSGGIDPEPIERIRGSLATASSALGRIVSRDDFEAFARTFPGIAKATATFPKGVAVVISVLGDPSAPIVEGDRRLLSLQRALMRWSDAAFEVRVLPGIIETIAVHAKVRLLPGQAWEPRRLMLREALAAAFEFERRRLGQPAQAWEALAAMQAVEGVDYVALERFAINERTSDQDYSDELGASVGNLTQGAQLLIANPQASETIFIEEIVE